MGIMVSYMAKPMLPNWAHSRGKAHRMAKPKGISLAKPMVLTRLNHMAKPIEWQKPLGYPWQKPWNQNRTFECWVATTLIHFLDSYHDFLGANPY